MSRSRGFFWDEVGWVVQMDYLLYWKCENMEIKSELVGWEISKNHAKNKSTHKPSSTDSSILIQWQWRINYNYKIKKLTIWNFVFNKSNQY